MDNTDVKTIAQARLGYCDIRPGQIYQHHKGGFYTIVAVGINEETMEPMVVYIGNLSGAIWIRTLVNFQDNVLPGKNVPRFRRHHL